MQLNDWKQGKELNMANRKRVVVGMSGGVDSTVAAYLLKQQGYEVIGITMRLWADGEETFAADYGGCCSLSAVEDARRVSNALDIPFYVVNFKELFKEKVITYFLDEYENGRTPNPCIACNKLIKFDALLKKALELDAHYVATGHYARISKENGQYVVRKSCAEAKDQTYALYNLTQEQLDHVLMPLGDLPSKDETRKIAEALDITIARKSDSQEICFIPDDNYSRFVGEERPNAVVPGEFVDLQGNVLGRHAGIIHYTIGQRKGLGITFGKPMFVVGIDASTNRVILGEGDAVFGKELIVEQVNFIPFKTLESSIQAECKIRYSAQPAPCTIEPIGMDTVKVTFDAPQRAITPGQAAVFYQGDLLVGGGIIRK